MTAGLDTAEGTTTATSTAQINNGVDSQAAGGRYALEARWLTRELPLGHEMVHILRGVSFTVSKGEFVALVGPSGSGKSTLLGLIAGLDNPTGGQMLIDGIDITRMSESGLAGLRNQKVGMVFQAFNLIPTLTAQENVEMPLYVSKTLSGSPAERAREVLSEVGLGHRLDHRPSQLSGGEQQRVAIARAIVTSPAIVIADEPTGNLDRTNGEAVLALMRDLRDRLGTTFLVATHDTEVAGSADRQLRLVDGLLVDGQESPPPTA